VAGLGGASLLADADVRNGTKFVRHPWRRTASSVALTTLTLRPNGHVYQWLTQLLRDATSAVQNRSAYEVGAGRR
jgi:hypothetical protein